MTDNEIMKALDFCEGYNGVSFCSGCPLFDKDNCIHILSHEAYNLINRQKSDIKRLKVGNKILTKNAYTAFQDGLNEAQDLYASQIRNEVRQEVIKEFAEKFKEKISQGVCCGRLSFVETKNELDNLVKEMTEE